MKRQSKREVLVELAEYLKGTKSDSARANHIALEILSTLMDIRDILDPVEKLHCDLDKIILPGGKRKF